MLVGGLHRDACDPTLRRVALDGAGAGGEVGGHPVAGHEAIGDALLAALPARHGEEGVIRGGDAGDIGAFLRPVLGPRSPGAVARRQAVYGDALAEQRQLPRDAAELVEVAGRPERRAGPAQRTRRHHPIEAQVHPAAVPIHEAQRITHARLQHPDRDASGQGDVLQVLVPRQAQGGVVRRVRHLPGQVRRVVPNPGAAGDGADVGPRHGVKPAAQLALRMAEREPTRFRHPPAVAHLREVEPVIGRGEHGLGGGGDVRWCHGSLLLPLPLGEGWGEGVFVRTSRPRPALPCRQVHSPRRSQDPLTPTLSRREREQEVTCMHMLWQPPSQRWIMAAGDAARGRGGQLRLTRRLPREVGQRLREADPPLRQRRA